MADDIRYSEFLFLQALANGTLRTFNPVNDPSQKNFGVQGSLYVEMVATLVEELYVRFQNEELQHFVTRLRRELGQTYRVPHGWPEHLWDNPREGIQRILNGERGLQDLCITYRGLRHIEELREILRRDRILEDFGVLLSIRYFRRDLKDAVRQSETSVSVLYADMDDFGGINKKFGQEAGDVVMKAYLEIVRDCVGIFGSAYRGVGDETVALIRGQEHQRAKQIAESIRKKVSEMECKYKEQILPKVSASIGVATSPPDVRSSEIEGIAEERKRKAKESGKNRVIAD
jgi:diguanylate cyclase (GGDEF)-like protein